MWTPEAFALITIVAGKTIVCSFSGDLFVTFRRFLEHDARLERAFGGLSVALTNIQKAGMFCVVKCVCVCFWLFPCVVALVLMYLT